MCYFLMCSAWLMQKCPFYLHCSSECPTFAREFTAPAQPCGLLLWSLTGVNQSSVCPLSKCLWYCMLRPETMLGGSLFLPPGMKVLPWCKTRSGWSSPFTSGDVFLLFEARRAHISAGEQAQALLSCSMYYQPSEQASFWLLQGHFIFRADAWSRKKTVWSVGSALSSQCWQQKATSFDVQAEFNQWKKLFGPVSCHVLSVDVPKHGTVLCLSQSWFIIDLFSLYLTFHCFSLSLFLISGFFSLHAFLGSSFSPVCLKSILETLVAQFSDLFWASASCCCCCSCQWIKRLSHHFVNFAVACGVAELKPSRTNQATTTKAKTQTLGLNLKAYAGARWSDSQKNACRTSKHYLISVLL